MSPDANDPKNLEICKQDVVFQHFPMARLLENPGTWSVNKYKYGRLIEKDSNDLEWIYVIKSGEARVLKYLSPGHVDLKARRKKIQLQLEAQSPFHKKRQILNFIEERDYIKSAYRPSTYHPERRKGLMSAPPGSRYHDAPCRSSNAFYSLPTTPAARPTTQHGALRSPSKLQTIQDLDGEETDLKLPKIKTDLVDENEEEQKKEDEDEQDGKKSPVKTGGEKTSRSGGSLAVTLEGVDQGEMSRSTRRPSTVHHAAPSRHCSIGSYIRTPLSGRSGQSRKGANPPSSVEQTVLPAFVQIETLHPGQVFGLRACLETEERGPSVSLVSGECEVLQINKKYFMRHCDDALYSLIRLKAKAFPDQEELIDRLDANMQWEEFKKRTLHDYLRQRIRHTR